jgi:hypothetical protein
MRLRVLVALSCLIAMVLVLVLIISKSSWHPSAANDYRDLMRNLRAPLKPEIWEAQEQSFDTNSIPLLAKALETRPGKVDQVYARAWSNAPAAIRSRLPHPLDSAAAKYIRENASALLAAQKIAGSVPPSTLTKQLQDPSWVIRMSGMACLYAGVLPKSGPSGLGEEKEKIFALLLAAAQDPEQMVRGSALGCLRYFKEASAELIPIFSQALRDPSREVRIRAALAFYKFDPALAEKAGALTTTIDYLQTGGRDASENMATDFLQNTK